MKVLIEQTAEGQQWAERAIRRKRRRKKKCEFVDKGDKEWIGDPSVGPALA